MSRPPKSNLSALIAEELVKPARTSAPAPAAAAGEGERVVSLDPPRPRPVVRATEPPAPPAKARLKERAHQMSLYLEPPVYEQLRELGFAERKKLHGLVLEGLDLLFKKRGLKSMAQLEKADE